VSAASLFWIWTLIAAVCTFGIAIARSIVQRVQHAEAERSRQQWQHMCEELGAEDLSAGAVHDTSPRVQAGDAIPSEAAH
jgi:hypothetical protein